MFAEESTNLAGQAQFITGMGLMIMKVPTDMGAILELDKTTLLQAAIKATPKAIIGLQVDNTKNSERMTARCPTESRTVTTQETFSRAEAIETLLKGSLKHSWGTKVGIKTEVAILGLGPKTEMSMDATSSNEGKWPCCKLVTSMQPGSSPPSLLH
jgi:hypothetical protein